MLNITTRRGAAVKMHPPLLARFVPRVAAVLLMVSDYLRLYKKKAHVGMTFSQNLKYYAKNKKKMNHTVIKIQPKKP